jgi:hypothetical protein
MEEEFSFAGDQAHERLMQEIRPKTQSESGWIVGFGLLFLLAFALSCIIVAQLSHGQIIQI